MAAAAVQQRLDRAEQLKLLPRQMAAVSGKVGSSRYGPAQDHFRLDDLLPESETRLAVPQLLVEVLPNALPRGTVAVLSEARSLPLSMVAAVTAAGGNTAIVSLPNIGLLATMEMGADLSRLALIPDPGAGPVEVAAVLMAGMDLVVLGLNGRSVPLTRARAIVARAQHKGCTLLVTDGDWQGASIRLEARVCGYQITAGDVAQPHQDSDASAECGSTCVPEDERSAGLELAESAEPIHVVSGNHRGGGCAREIANGLPKYNKRKGH
jgi:hypothetical protein